MDPINPKQQTQTTDLSLVDLPFLPGKYLPFMYASWDATRLLSFFICCWHHGGVEHLKIFLYSRQWLPTGKRPPCRYNRT